MSDTSEEKPHRMPYYQDIYNPNHIVNTYIVRIIERLTKTNRSFQMEILVIIFLLSFQGAKTKLGEIALKIVNFILEKSPKILIENLKNCLPFIVYLKSRFLTRPPPPEPKTNVCFAFLEQNLFTVNMLHNFFIRNSNEFSIKNNFRVENKSKCDVTRSITHHKTQFYIGTDIVVELLDMIEVTFDDNQVIDFKIQSSLDKEIPFSKGKNITFKVSSEHEYSNKQLYDHFNDYFGEKIKQYAITEKTDKLISVYYIKVNHTTETLQKLNPDYTDWEGLMGRDKDEKDISPVKEKEKKSNDSDSSNGSRDNLSPGSSSSVRTKNYSRGEFIELLKMKPEKYIEEKTAQYSVECREINKIYKQLDTLYLRNRDKAKLTNVVDSFKNRKETYEQLGIPYKLGMLFHGLPGTGKTSAIKAIASYLNKDIYFVHLNTVKSNKQLKEIFEYINEKCNGGIIVFEDIDAASEIVAARSCTGNGIKDQNLSETISEEDSESLTLSYLLNLLDGTICREGTIFAITTNYLNKIDSAIYRPGRVDIKVEFLRCDSFQIKEIYQAILGRPIPGELLSKIDENKYTPSDIIFFLYQYMMITDVTDEEIVNDLLDNLEPTV